MNIFKKTAAAVLAAAALTAIGAGVASAAPSTRTPSATAGQSSLGAANYTRGFHFYNLTTTPMTLMSITGDSNYQAPNVGSVIEPGGSADFEISYMAFRTENDTVTYSNGPGTIQATLTVDGTETAGEADSTCTVKDGPVSCTDSDNGFAHYTGDNIAFLESAGTYTYDSTQPQLQMSWLDQLCTGGADATCSFLPTSETMIQAQQRQAGDSFTNASNLEVDYTLASTDTVSVADNVGVSPTANGGALARVQIGDLLRYGHTWPGSYDYKTSLPLHVPAKTKVWFDDAPQLVRVTGNFAITLGNTHIDLTGVSFVLPDPNGNVNWTLMSQPISGGPITATTVN